jgi:hypothetical protein
VFFLDDAGKGDIHFTPVKVDLDDTRSVLPGQIHPLSRLETAGTHPGAFDPEPVLPNHDDPKRVFRRDVLHRGVYAGRVRCCAGEVDDFRGSGGRRVGEQVEKVSRDRTGEFGSGRGRGFGGGARGVVPVSVSPKHEGEAGSQLDGLCRLRRFAGRGGGQRGASG